MVFKKFTLTLTLRVLLLAALTAAFIYSLLVLKLVFTSAVTGIAVVAALLEMIRFVNRTNRELAGFLEAIRYHDFSNRYVEKGTGQTSDELHKAFNLILAEYRRLQFEKEVHASFLESLVKAVPVGIICLNENGQVILYNDTAQKITGISRLPHLDVISKLIPDLHERINTMVEDRPEVIRLQKGEHKLEVSLRVIHLELGGKPSRIIVLQNIKGELELYEVEAWQKLIRVLTHEIINSVTPIASLSGTLLSIADKPGELNEEQEDMRDGIRAIRERSKALLNFVEQYRRFTRIPAPASVSFNVSELFARLNSFYNKRSAEQGVQLDFDCADNLYIHADPEQIEQVLINLLNNAFDAVEGLPEGVIKVKCRSEEGRMEISVCDNGTGISPGSREKIFVPFFTTKETGSGIGLSLSRQILLRNKAAISFRDNNQLGTCFTIRF